MDGDQYPLFDGAAPSSHGRARRSDPATSHEAAQKIDPAAIRRRMVQIVRASADGVIWDDLRTAFPGVKETSISPRIKEVETAGLVYRSGEKRRGSSGVNQLVIRAVSNPAPPHAH
jgi:hypothetical protein